MNEAERSRRFEVALGTLACCLAVLYLRKPAAFTNPQFWGEDGPQFFDRARELGAASLLEHYNGYIHLIPRVVAWGVSWIPPVWAPAAYNAAAIAVMILAAAWCFSPRLGLSTRTAAAGALALVLAPHSGVVFANLTNVLNVLVLPLVLLVLAADAVRTRERVTDLAILLGAGLTGPYVAAMAPLFAVRALIRRTRWSTTLLVVATALGAIQLARLGGARTPGELDLSDPTWMLAAGARGAGAMLLGWLDRAGLEFDHVAYASGLALASAGLYVFVFVGGALSRSRLAIVAGAASLVLHGLVAWAYRGNPFYLANENLDRYSYPALVAFAWALIAVAGRGALAWPARVLLAAMVLSSLGAFSSPPPPDLRWGDGCAVFEENVPAQIAITPPGWFVRFSPRRVDRDAAHTALEDTLGRDVTDIRPTDVVPTHLWTGHERVTGLPVNAGCVFDVSLGVTAIDFEVWIVGAHTRPGAWTRLIVATVADPDQPDVLLADRVELAPRVGKLGPERRRVDLPAERKTTRIGVGAYGGEGTAAWYVAWRIVGTD